MKRDAGCPMTDNKERTPFQQTGCHAHVFMSMPQAPGIVRTSPGPHMATKTWPCHPTALAPLPIGWLVSVLMTTFTVMAQDVGPASSPSLAVALILAKALRRLSG